MNCTSPLFQIKGWTLPRSGDRCNSSTDTNKSMGQTSKFIRRHGECCWQQGDNPTAQRSGAESIQFASGYGIKMSVRSVPCLLTHRLDQTPVQTCFQPVVFKHPHLDVPLTAGQFGPSLTAAIRLGAAFSEPGTGPALWVSGAVRPPGSHWGG